MTFSEHTAARATCPGARSGVDIVLECSGKFRTPELLKPYFDEGVRKVIVAAPVKDGALNVVMGCNDHLYDPGRHHLLTAASCTTNCLAPVVKVIHEGIGIRHGRHHDHPRRDQHPGGRGRAAQGPPPCALRPELAHPDDHRLGDGHRAHLPGAERASSTASPCACPS